MLFYELHYFSLGVCYSNYSFASTIPNFSPFEYMFYKIILLIYRRRYEKWIIPSNEHDKFYHVFPCQGFVWTHRCSIASYSLVNIKFHSVLSCNLKLLNKLVSHSNFIHDYFVVNEYILLGSWIFLEECK